MKNILITGAGGFIGSHMAKAQKLLGNFVIGADLKYPEFSESKCDAFYKLDLRDYNLCKSIFKNHKIDEVYTLAADMGGAGYIFTGRNDLNILHNSCQINLNIAEMACLNKVNKLFFSSSACVYPMHNQQDPDNPICSENSAYPANPDSEYGWEKIFSERLYLACTKNHSLNIKIARFHNIFGPEGTWCGGKEKAPAAICRKVIEASDHDSIEIWGLGTQTRSFLYIDECIEGTIRLMNSDFSGPVNIGSSEMISINNLAKMIINISGKTIEIKNIPGPIGVFGRSSDNILIKEKLNWEPSMKLIDGITNTYKWITSQIKK